MDQHEVTTRLHNILDHRQFFVMLLYSKLPHCALDALEVIVPYYTCSMQHVYIVLPPGWVVYQGGLRSNDNEAPASSCQCHIESAHVCQEPNFALCIGTHRTENDDLPFLSCSETINNCLSCLQCLCYNLHEPILTQSSFSISASCVQDICTCDVSSRRAWDATTHT